ncbi:Homeodomain-like domain-containing protein [Branchiibius hedensis]|uniref:Homeodomain-like domain-containing protein n=2 Tax=Branchiibius hedensis TaxID=672460 RepID=A0A2Y9BPG8_9MICO|nr:Homeodomain-like domain-containing protein [Branchiibius hedensis]SSA58990.1 Homeodomain-like domain-containing protein [Branchiibius hedensis]
MPTSDPNWAKHWRLDRYRGITRYIDAAPTRRHIEQLRTAGASMRAIADKAGVSVSQISRIAGGQEQVRRPYAARIQAVTPAAILARSGAEDFVPAVGARRRIEALQAIGHSSTTIAEAMAGGATADVVRNIKGHPGAWISRTNHERALRAYERLWDTPGTSRQTLGAARRLGFAPPLAWDDDTIDDPGGQPWSGEETHDLVDEVAVLRAVAGDRVGLTVTERAEAVRRLAATGLSDNEIGVRIRVTSRTVQRIRKEFDIPSSWKESAA